MKDDRLAKSQYPQNDGKKNQMHAIPYAAFIGSLMYKTISPMLFVHLGDRYLSDLGLNL